MPTKPKVEDHYELVVEYFGHQLQFPYQDGPEPTVGGVLYETFALRCVLDERYGSFGASIAAGPLLATTEFFGRRLSRSSDSDSIITSLATIDRWCRAHLPADFLMEYDANVTGAS